LANLIELREEKKQRQI